jgi:hypothetical protein
MFAVPLRFTQAEFNFAECKRKTDGASLNHNQSKPVFAALFCRFNALVFCSLSASLVPGDDYGKKRFTF